MPATPEESAPPADREQSFISHLIELRSRILASALCVVAVFLCLSYFSNDIYLLVARPLMKLLPPDSKMIATEVAAPFLAPFKLTFVVSILLAMPVVLYQAWRFVAPGLYTNERRLVLPLLVSSTALFYLGVAFAYFIVFPVMFRFFTTVAPAGVTVMTDINKYLDFVLATFLAFGVVFEIPVATVLLVWAGIIEHAKLKELRPYVIVGCFVVAALLTPPDVVSQTMLAVPMWLLFEAGVFVSGLLPAAERQAEPVINPRATGGYDEVGPGLPDAAATAGAESDRELDAIEARESGEK